MTEITYLAIFLLVAQGMRNLVQLERLISVLILTSVPVSLYTLAQHMGVDPISWLGNLQVRAIAMMGNPIFLAAYETMVVFPTMAPVS